MAARPCIQGELATAHGTRPTQQGPTRGQKRGNAEEGRKLFRSTSRQRGFLRAGRVERPCSQLLIYQRSVFAGARNDSGPEASHRLPSPNQELAMVKIPQLYLFGKLRLAGACKNEYRHPYLD